MEPAQHRSSCCICGQEGDVNIAFTQLYSNFDMLEAEAIEHELRLGRCQAKHEEPVTMRFSFASNSYERNHAAKK